jgi:1-pyrroline-5-carboxylate dehydrogenase
MNAPGAVPRVTYSNIGTDFTAVHDLLDRLIPAVKRDRLGRRWPNRIGGRTDDDGRGYAARSPIDRDLLLGEFVEASPAAVGRAVGAARDAFADWSERPWQERVRILRHAADLLHSRAHELAAACLLEVGKSRLEAVGEAEEAVDLIRYYCTEMERNEGYVHPLERALAREETLDVLRPHGVFGVIAPFNFPLALSVGMVSGALLTANTVVYKPSPMAGLTGMLLVATLHEAGVPGDALNVVCGGAEVGRTLVADPRLAGVAFTGSHAAGMEIFRRLAAGPHARPVIVEMGGKNPAYVTARADLETAVEGVVRSAFGLQGQKCSACSTVFVQEPVYDSFLARLVERSRGLAVGNPEGREVFMGPLIDERAARRFETASRRAEADGRLALGGRLLEGGLFDRGHYAPPTVAVDLPADHPLHGEELFLPFLIVRRFGALDEAIADGNRVVYGLTAGIYSEDEAELESFLRTAEAGALYANRASGATTGAWPGVQSFAGWKGSGVSSKGGLGPYYLPQFMREQSRTIMRKG